MPEPVLIGLCGRSGSGKGYVSRIFFQAGIPAVDTDALYRNMTSSSPELSPCMSDLHAAFGDAVVHPDNSLNRRALADIVFDKNNTAARQQLNRITHAHILTETKKVIAEYGESGFRYVLIDAPLLFESGFDRMCRYTVCVTASDETSIARIVQRDGISEEEARRRLAAQIPQQELVRRCDFHIANDGGFPSVEEQTAAVIKAIRREME